MVESCNEKIIFQVDEMQHMKHLLKNNLRTLVSDSKQQWHINTYFIRMMFVIAMVTSTIIICHLIRFPGSQEARQIVDTVVSCYYNTPSADGEHQLLPLDIHPHLCTHINVAFAQIEQKQIKLDKSQLKSLKQIIKLKQLNPNLKILLSIGGSGGDSGFADMVVDHASRKTFIKSVKSFLRDYSLDGIDLDWEFPALHSDVNQIGSRQRQHFSQLLREIRAEYQREKRDYLLTVAVAAPEPIVNVAYDIDQINMYVDYVNIMTYDFHIFTKYTPFTGLNAPLFARESEHLYMATLNVNYTVHMYLDKGLEANKIVVGIPTYGHSFTLVNVNNNNVGSPASGFGQQGSLGFVNYPEVCKYLNEYKFDVVTKYDNDTKVPYLFRSKDWMSYDSPQSVMEKAKYIKEHNLRGAMIYSLNADDYDGKCAQGGGQVTRFPLLQSIKNILKTKEPTKEIILLA